MKTSHRLTVAALVMAAFNLSAGTLFVSLESTNPIAPYTTWATAATNIQQGVDAAAAGDTVLVTNGVYAVGERDVSVLDTNTQPPQLMSIGLSRVVVTNSIRLESVNGPLVTTIVGRTVLTNVVMEGGRCVWLASGASLSGFTLTNGYAHSGGGLWCESASVVVSNCVIVGNCAGEGTGGGAYGGTLNNITDAPLFVDYAVADFCLRPDSPCIDAGTNLAGLVSTDILGLPRPMDGNGDGLARFDIGAYEFNPYRFEPTLQMGVEGFQFTLRGEPGRLVRVERSRDLQTWELFDTVPLPVSGQMLIDPAATTEPQLFYRAVRVP